jgi:chemotaxis methyl-accepting protein methylase
MPAYERRKTPRNSNNENGAALIELDHSFGAVKNSVYKINEYGESGLSFLVPHSDGYFITNTPITFSLIHNGQSQRNLLGTVKYYHPYYDKLGDNYYKIGVEKTPPIPKTSRTVFKIRPRRHMEKGSSKPVIEFQLHNKIYKYKLIDISKYSAAFYCRENDLISFSLSSILNAVNIFSGRNSIFEGKAIITRTYQVKNGKSRVIIEPRNELFNIDLLKQQKTISSSLESTISFINKHSADNDIDKNFKVAVADLRFFWEDLHKHLETPQVKTSFKEQPELLKEIFNPFYNAVDKKVTRIESIIKNLRLTPEQTSLYKCYYQKNLLRFLTMSPFNSRVYCKPSGFPGDYMMIRMLHQDQFAGETLLGKLINKYSTSTPISLTVRKRTKYFADKIKSAAKKNKPLKILSIASGPAIEFELLLENNPEVTDNISITFLDLDIGALRYSQNNLYENRIKANSKIKFNFVHQNVGNYLRSLARKKISADFDIIYASGIFDYFDTKTGQFVIKNLLTQTRSGGKIIIANLSLDGHNHKTLMEFGHEWYLTYRSRKEMLELSNVVPKGKTFKINEIEKGICKFIEIKN